MVPLDDLNAEQLDECVHALLSSYSDWLCNTNIPYNAAEVLANPRSAAQPPTNFLKYSTLKEYLSKAINLVRSIIPRSDFWNDTETLENISGAKFEKACRRRQQLKSNNFGEVSRIGLYMRTPYSTHTVSVRRCSSCSPIGPTPPLPT
mmetsp:Transcript_5525/g.12483  ORF Transcript_5525/g.12483 Transcript_5525/m.12483 type:complete len:148 (+) Transcript_5525:230-673(+)